MLCQITHVSLPVTSPWCTSTPCLDHSLTLQQLKMRTCFRHALLALSSVSASYAKINTKCVHPGVRDVLRNECAEFIMTAGSDTYGVRLPITASQGAATIGTLYDDKRRRAMTESMSMTMDITVSLPPTATATPTVTMAVPAISIPDEDSDDEDENEDVEDTTLVLPVTTTISPLPTSIPFGPSTTVSDLSTLVTSSFIVFKPGPDGSLVPVTTQSSLTTIVGTSWVSLKQESSAALHASDTPAASSIPSLTYYDPSTTMGPSSSLPDVIGAEPTCTSSIVYPINDQIGPGTNNVPLKAIKGLGQDGKAVTYPNKHGSSLCKKAKGCISIDKVGPVTPCIADLQNKIHQLAMNRSDLTFAPMEPITCSPALSSKYCAWVELVPWAPKDEKNKWLLNEMNTKPYNHMSYNEVPIGAVSEGIDWIRDGKAKLCGETLLPVPQPGTANMAKSCEKGKVYVLKVDVNPGLPDMRDDIIDAHESLNGQY